MIPSLYGWSIQACTVLLVYSTHALAHLSRILLRDDSSDQITFFPHLILAPPNSQMCIQLFVTRGFLQCNPTIISLAMWLSADCSCWHSLITSFSVPRGRVAVLFILTHHTNARATRSSNVRFPTDLNADVPLVTVPIETIARVTEFVTKAPSICTPKTNPLSKSLRFFPLAVLIQNS